MNFVKTFFASLLAVVVGFGLAIMILSMIAVGMMAAFGSSSAVVVHPKSVLRLNIGTITDSPAASPLGGFDLMSMSVKPRVTLLKTIQAIQAAANDSRIKGIYLNFDETASVSISSLEEIRAELVKFKESGKFIVAYQEGWAQVDYWLSSVADKVYINPAGDFQWTGLSAGVMFYKGLLDKLEIEPVVVRHGSFKSAVEPFILDKMSPENRLQYEKLVGSMWGVLVEEVAASRGIAQADLQKWADELAIDSPAASVERKLTDGVKYEDEVMTEMAALIEEGLEEPEIVSFSDYASQIAVTNPSSKNKIAIIYAEGEIVSGEGSDGQVGSTSLVEKIRQVRDDEGTVAAVLRINSPGGSALASEVMWRELELLKAKKPLIVSMGEYAASGGYYIASPADAIYANRSTLTGSIGVLGIFLNVGEGAKNKLGITMDRVNSNRYSDIGSTFRSPAKAEIDYIQKSVEDVYATFVGHVADGRNMTPEAVDTIGQGRVWSGADALEIGLIDGYGGLVDALSLAAERVGVSDDFRVWEVVNEMSPLDALFQGMFVSVRERTLKDELGETFDHYQYLRSMFDEPGVQARLPYVVEIN
ncbi:MAG: signal peptide peptidase SppA [Alistipes sp.]|jgi:protease-4|nr:signal peptide peptidase SppA [Alistipes sp.]